MGEQYFFSKIENQLIVSCQALADEPLHSSFIMSRMALAAAEAGAKGIRANSVVDIEAIQATVSLPIIGIIKKDYPDSDVFITPTLSEVRALAKTGCEVIAMDGTARKRPLDEKLSEIVKTIKLEFPNVLLMADCSTVAEGIQCEQIGFDIIATTLVGYTEETKKISIDENDFKMVREFKKNITLPLIVEGNINTPEKARRVLELGAYSVVVGSSITRPQLIAAKYVAAIEKWKENKYGTDS